MVNRKKQRHKLEQILSACGYKSDLSEADLSNFDEAMGTLKVYRLRYNLLKRKNPEAAEAEWVKGKLEAYLMCPDIFPKGERLKIYDDLVKYSNHVIKNAGDQRNFDWYVYDNYDILKQHTPEEVHPLWITSISGGVTT